MSTTSTDEFPRQASNCNGSEEAYSIEARFNSHEPRTFGGIMLDNRWRAVSLIKSATLGVPPGPEYCHHSRHLGLLGYSAAQALRWWLHAEADKQICGGICLETRLIKHKIQFAWTNQELSAHAYVGGDGSSGQWPDPERGAVSPQVAP